MASAIARRPFLPGEAGPWTSRTRDTLRDVLLRTLDCLSPAWVAAGDPVLAARDAAEAIAIEPLRESAYRNLMHAHAAAGNRAEALQAYARCREVLSEELGVDPSKETEAVYLEILRSS